MSGSCGLVPVVLFLIVAVTETQAQCTQQELNTLFECITPHNDKFKNIFGTEGSCNRTLISEDVCKDFVVIADCANQKNVSPTCEPHVVEQIDQRLVITCKVNDFKQVCHNDPVLDTVTETQAKCTDQELKTLFECITPHNDKFLKIFGTGGSCNRNLISENVCNNFSAIVVCANEKDVSRTCRPHAEGQIDKELIIPCKVNDFKEVCHDAPAFHVGDPGGASGVNISLWLLGVVIIVSLIAHM